MRSVRAAAAAIVYFFKRRALLQISPSSELFVCMRRRMIVDPSYSEVRSTVNCEALSPQDNQFTSCCSYSRHSQDEFMLFSHCSLGVGANVDPSQFTPDPGKTDRL